MQRGGFSEICGTRLDAGEVVGVGPANTLGADDRPRLLDLFCGAGGAAMGYHRAGFKVVGIDINPQPNYPFAFHRLDALIALGDLAAFGPLGFAAIHASPPCQRFSTMTSCRPGLAQRYDDLIGATRELLLQIGLPYVIENVPGSPLIDPVELCGQQFRLELYRHRLFESNFPIMKLDHCQHRLPASRAGHWKPGTVMSVAGHVAPIAKAREVMGIDWTTREELAEAIPPAYTEYVGTYLHAEVWDRQQPERRVA
jgi:DNA (cytosine-5)-methyltransferase 1